MDDATSEIYYAQLVEEERTVMAALRYADVRRIHFDWATDTSSGPRDLPHSRRAGCTRKTTAAY